MDENRERCNLDSTKITGLTVHDFLTVQIFKYEASYDTAATNELFHEYAFVRRFSNGRWEGFQAQSGTWNVLHNTERAYFEEQFELLKIRLV